MTTKAKSSKNMRLQRGDGAGSETFTTIAECTNVKGPDEKVALLDATSFDSTAMEYISGLSDGQEVSFDANWIGSDAQQQGLRTDLRAGTVRNFKFLANDSVSGSDPSYVIFAAIVVMVPGLTAGVNQVMKGAWTLKPTGLPTWHYTAS